MILDEAYLEDRLAKSKMIEGAFALAAAGILPLEKATYEITPSANIYYTWLAPSEFVGKLVVWFDEVEIVLATNTIHTHIGAGDYRRRHGYLLEGEMSCEDEEFVQFIAEAAVIEAAAIMSGNRVFASGGRGKGGMKFPLDVWESRNDGSSFDEMGVRFWTWHEEIFRS